MNHPFTASQTSADVCARCKFPFIAHGPEAECETCGNKGPVEIRYGNMLMCPSCWQKEVDLKNTPINGVPAEKVHNIQAEMIAEAKRIDTALEVKENIFNAETISLMDVKKAIDENVEITNKPYAFAEFVLGRLHHIRKIGFELSEQVVDNNNIQRALQTTLNNLSNQLRAEEREKLKLKDINYNPSAIKPRTPKPIKTATSKIKIDKVLLKKLASEIGVSEFMIQQICVAKGCDVEAAGNIVKGMLNAAKSIKD